MNLFDPSSGGQVAMHKLCHDINSLGRTSYITSSDTHYKLKSPFLGDRSIDMDNCVVIYPEITHGNPLGARHVVRWILNTPGLCGGVGNGFYNHKLDSDLIFKLLKVGLKHCTFVYPSVIVHLTSIYSGGNDSRYQNEMSYEEMCERWVKMWR